MSVTFWTTLIRERTVGVDVISPRLLRLGSPVLAEGVTNLISFCILNRSLPYGSKTASLLSLYKRGIDTDKANYRPVPILGSRLSTTTATAARTSQKQKVWLAKQQLCTCITFFCTFLCGHCTTTAWKSLISRFMEDVLWQATTNFFLFQNLSVVPKKLTPGKFSYIWHFQESGISATKFETDREFILKVTFSLPSPSSMLKLPINVAIEGVWESYLWPNLECISQRFVPKLSGFMKTHSCCTALLKMTEDWRTVLITRKL